MASKSKRKEDEIKSYYAEEVKEVKKDDGLKRNEIMNTLAEEHGKAMSAHSAEYTKLLEEYIANSKKTSTQKKLFKNVFFWVAISTLCLSFLLFAGICIYFSLQDFSQIEIEGLAAPISSLVSLLSLYIIIPKIIAKYLFNVKEDKHMAKIVKSVQKYDAKVFANINTDEKPIMQENEKEIGEMKFMSDLKKRIEEDKNTQGEEEKKKAGGGNKKI